MTPIRFSNLKHIARSPAHYLASLNTDFEPTAAMRTGTIVHAMVLGGRLTVYEGERRGNAWKEFKAAHDGTTIVTAKEVEAARPVADAVLADRRVRELLEGTTREETVFWDHVGRACRGTPDAYRSDMVLDLKSTTDTRPDKFEWQCRRMAYTVQAVWYADGLRRAGKANPERHVIVGVEVKAPYPVTVFELTPRMVDEARRTYGGWMETLRVCEESDRFPAYSEAILPLDVIETEAEIEFDITEAAE